MTQYKNGKGHEDKQTDSGDFELVNLNSISIDGGFKHSGKFINESDDGILYKNDLVMILSDVGHGDLLGRVALIPDDNKFILNQRVALLRPNKTVNPEFLFFYINSHQKYFKSQGAGMSQLNISKKSVETFSSLVPNIDEQKKISLFLMKLDSLIALHQRKLEHLQEQKKGLLQKMFPKNGENVPEVRFPGFTDAWEQRKLGDYLSIPTKEPITDINELKLMTLKLNLEGITLTANRETLKLGATKYYKRHEGQLLYGKQNFFHGSIALIPQEAEGYATSGDVPALDISNVNGKYLVDYISRPSYFKAKEALATGTGSKRIHEKTLLNFKITVPSLEEQNAISDFITNYTNLITLHQRKLEHLELMKKGLLQQMFV